MALAAGIGAAGSILGGIGGKKGANKAAQAYTNATNAALAQQQQQFATTQANLSPYITAGNGALGAQQTLLGLNGNDAQQQAIANLQAAPAFTSLYGTGLDAINQNAAATGGLRGGNTALAQSNFGSSLLATVIQNQLGNLSGISAQGANAAGGLSSAGQASANATSNLLTQQGGVNASNAAQQATIGNNTINGLLQSVGKGLNSFGGISASTVAGLNPAAQSVISSNPNIF